MRQTFASRDHVVDILFLQRRKAEVGHRARVAVACEGDILSGGRGFAHCWSQCARETELLAKSNMKLKIKELQDAAVCLKRPGNAMVRKKNSRKTS